jgi:hypothetical protein
MKKNFSFKIILIILFCFLNYNFKHLKKESYKLLEKNINNKEINKLSNKITNSSNNNLDNFDYIFDEIVNIDLSKTIYYRTIVSLLSTVLLIIIVLVILNYLIKISNNNDVYNNFYSISEEQIKLICYKNIK